MGDSHEWAGRHTAESWKERYKKNAIKFDARIEEIVKLEGRSRKLLWPEDRRAGHKYQRGKHKIEPEEESSEEYEEEPQQPLRKRRRSDYSSSPPNRVVQRRSDEKGKARADEEEMEEEGDTYDSDPFEGLFSMDEMDEYEPGPSRSRHPLEATTVAADHLTHRTQPNTASFFTQETVVASASSGRSVQAKEASHLPDEAAESSSRPSTQVSRGAKEASPSGLEPLEVINLTPPSTSTGRNSHVIQHSPTRTLVNPTQTQATQPSTYKRPLKAARRPRAMIEAAVADAPYKNTRSRSQSVEPYTSNPPVREGGTKGKRKAVPELATVDEILDDRQGSEKMEVENEPVPPSVDETPANEVEVEKMLIEDEDEDEDEEPDDADQVRGVSLDTDDAQTEQNLRPTQPPPRQAIPSLRMHPSEILKEFQEHSAILTNRSSVPLTGRPRLSNKRPAVPVRHIQENTFNIPSSSLGRNVVYKTAEPPRTPLARPRNNSASSTEIFPVSGTRASTLKKRLQQLAKRNPYNPPGGTRAAQFARPRN